MDNFEFRFRLVAVILFFLWEAAGFALETGGVEVQVNGIKEFKGQIVATLYSSRDGFPTKPEKAFAHAETPADAESVTLKFDNLPYGTYAVAILHDANANGKMDTNFLGIPREGYGASRDARGSFGPPSFEDAKVLLESAKLLLKIKMAY